ncbi:diacylglycerol/lipid kinase family protein [Sediminibacillus massiliensis]|uniref:diacylglycerol/lipid kinase family protein n=1 Tax=Sediminibacillus massiliensis TaxID=1926277 RepID=UPI0009888F86|nr:diacylglycerol kinase family protein [Sediminibacillus massiliensis]
MYIFIVNTFAGKGEGEAILRSIEKDPLYRQISCRSFYTEYEGHAEKIASQLAEMYGDQISCMIAVGGDGTFYEVLNGLSSHPGIPLGFIPSGTGNDFAKGYNIKGNAADIFKKIVSGKKWSNFWPGDYVTDKRTPKFRRMFANSIGFGFDAEIVYQVHKAKFKMKWLGSIQYLVALFVVWKSFKPINMEIVIDGKNIPLKDVWMVTVSNHPYYGGGMKINPAARINPDHFSILVVKGISPWKVLGLFFTVYWGKHVRFKEVSVLKAKQFEVVSDKPISFQVDGQPGKCKTCTMSKKRDSRKIFGMFTKLSS